MKLVWTKYKGTRRDKNKNYGPLRCTIALGHTGSPGISSPNSLRRGRGAGRGGKGVINGCYFKLSAKLQPQCNLAEITKTKYGLCQILINGIELSRWSGDIIRRTGEKHFIAVSHNCARPYFRIQHGRGEVRVHRIYLNVQSVTGNVVDTEWLSFGDGNTAGSLKTTPKAARGCGIRR